MEIICENIIANYSVELIQCTGTNIYSGNISNKLAISSEDKLEPTISFRWKYFLTNMLNIDYTCCIVKNCITSLI